MRQKIDGGLASDLAEWKNLKFIKMWRKAPMYRFDL